MVDIGELKRRKDVRGLIDALADEDQGVRWNASVELAVIGKPSVEPLITALGDENEEVRGYAVHALSCMGESAIMPLIAALKNEDEWVRLAATEALGTIGDEDEHVRWDAAYALGKFGDHRAIPALERATSDSDEDIRKRAEEALNNIKSREQKREQTRDVTNERNSQIDDKHGKIKETIKPVEEEPEPKIILKSKSEYHGANIDFKVSIENQLDHSIAEVKATLFVPQVFLLSEKEKTIGLIKPKERQTTTFTIRPIGECGNCTIEGEVTYFDTASNSHERMKIESKSVAVKCAMLKRFKTEDDAWFDITASLISTKETHEEIPVPAETLFDVATNALRSMNMSMLKPVRNSAPGYFSGSARYAALGAAGGMKYAAHLNVIGSEAAPSRMVLEAWAEEESALVGFYHKMLDTLEEQTEVQKRSLFIGSYTHIEKNVDGDDLSNGGTKITGDVTAPRSTIGGGGGGKPFSNCSHCGEALNLPETPRFCPYCGGQMS